MKTQLNNVNTALLQYTILDLVYRLNAETLASHSLLNNLQRSFSMSSDNTKKTTTPDEAIANAIKSVVSAVERKVKTEGKTPEFNFGLRVAESVKKNYEAGKLPTEEEIKSELLTLAVSKNPLTSAGLLVKANRLTTLALFLSKCDKVRADLKKAEPNATKEDIDKKASPLIQSMKSRWLANGKATESTSQ